METTYTWLPHLESSLARNVHSYTISTYAVVLEAWRRGITVKFTYDGEKKTALKYQLTHKNKTHYFQGTCGDLTSKEALEITESKKKLRDRLLAAGLPYPEGDVFSETATDEEIITYANKIGYPVVIKPFQGTGRTGVMPGVENEDLLRKAIHLIRHEQGFKEVMLEKHIDGEDYRAFVVDDKVAGTIKRVTAHVIGDGVSSVKQLIKQKNIKRKNNPALRSCLMKLDADVFYMLQKQSYQLESIPAEGEEVPLKSVCHIARGGDPVDVTDEVSDEVKKVAIAAHKAIPGLASSGIDLMVNEQTNEVYVIEISAMPHIRAQLFPESGTARDLPKAIIDYYFPETKNDKYHPVFNFDFERMWQGFKHGMYDTYTLPAYPTGELELTLLIIKTSQNHPLLKHWIQDIAINLGVDGYVRSISDDSMIVLVGGKVAVVGQFKQLIAEHLEEPDMIRERPSKKAVMKGFFIEENTYQEQALRFKEKEVEELEKERDECKEKYTSLINQPLWKFLKPFHKIDE